MNLPNIVAILEANGISLAALNADSEINIKVENGVFMPLTIESIGSGPGGNLAISVCHYFEQNGDLMQDPEVMFEYASGEFMPYAIQQAPVGRYAEVFSGSGTTLKANARLAVELVEFATMWDKNLGDAGYVKAAKGVA